MKNALNDLSNNNGTCHRKGDKSGQRICAKERVHHLIVDWSRSFEVWCNEKSNATKHGSGYKQLLKLVNEIVNILNTFVKTSKAGNGKNSFRNMKTTSKWHLHETIKAM